MLAPRKKGYNKPRQCIITLLTKVHRVKAMIFLVVMYKCEKWIIKKAEHQRIWTVVLEKTLESPLCSKEIKSIILKEIKPEYSLEGLMLKLKLLYFGYLMWRAISLEKNPNARKDWGQEEKGVTEDKNGWMASPTRWTWVWANSRRQWRTGKPGVLQSMG